MGCDLDTPEDVYVVRNKKTGASLEVYSYAFQALDAARGFTVCETEVVKARVQIDDERVAGFLSLGAGVVMDDVLDTPEDVYAVRNKKTGAWLEVYSYAFQALDAARGFTACETEVVKARVQIDFGGAVLIPQPGPTKRGQNARS